VTIRFHIGYWWSFGSKPPSLTVSEIFIGDCDVMVDMTLNDLYTNVKVIHIDSGMITHI